MGAIGADADQLPVKNTFIHFGRSRPRALRVCVTDPADPWVQPSKDFEPNEEVIREEPEDQLLVVITPEHSPRGDCGPGGFYPAPSPPWSQPGTPELRSSAPSGCTSPQGGPLHSFTLTLRLADGVGLGIDVASAASGRALLVRDVLADGAVESWNKQCEGSPASTRAIGPGDAIVRINEQEDCQGMLRECGERQLLKITVARWSEPLALSPDGCAWCRLWSSCSGTSARKLCLELHRAL